MRYHIPFFAVMLAMPLGASAQPLIQSQEGIALQNEILQLQQQVQKIHSAGGQGNGGSALGDSAAPASSASSGANSLLPSLLTQVQQLQSQVDTLNGQVSELQHQLTTQNAQTQQEIGNLKFQMTNGTPGAAGATAGAAAGAAASNAPAANAPQAPAPAATEAVPASPRDALRDAIEAYGKKDYRKAASVAQSIVVNHKSAPEAYRAQYLVAQSQAAMGSAQNAAVAYYSTYNMNKTGTYAPRALLGLASALADLKQNPQACETISSLNSQFTSPSPGIKRDIDRVSERAHCR